MIASPKRYALSVALLLAAAPLNAWAQQPAPPQHAPQPPVNPGIEPTPAQRDLNQRAIEAANAKDFERAVRLFQSSLDLGPLNITYLNLGRAHQRAGQCIEAEAAYYKAIDAVTPKVASPSQADMDTAVKKFLVELKNECPGYVTVSCQPASMTLYVNDQGPSPCDGKLTPLPRGQYTVYGEMNGQKTRSEVFTLEGLQQVRVNLSLTVVESKVVEVQERIIERAVEGPEKTIIIREVAPPPPPQSNVAAWVNVGIGAALVVGGLLWDTCMFSRSSRVTDRSRFRSQAEWQDSLDNSRARWCDHTYNGKFDALDIAPIGLYVVGAGLLLNGVFRF